MAAEQAGLDSLHLCWPQLLVAMETLVYHKVGGGVLVPARGEGRYLLVSTSKASGLATPDSILFTNPNRGGLAILLL